MSEEEKKAIEWLEKAEYFSARLYAPTILNLINNYKKEIKKEKSRIMELAELLDKQENEINSLQQELEIQKGCSISKDKIREKIEVVKDNNYEKSDPL